MSNMHGTRIFCGSWFFVTCPGARTFNRHRADRHQRFISGALDGFLTLAAILRRDARGDRTCLGSACDDCAVWVLCVLLESFPLKILHQQFAERHFCELVDKLDEL